MKLRALCAAMMLVALTTAPSPANTPETQISGKAINRSTVNTPITITAGNTFQTILPSILGTSTQRQGLTIQNNNASDNCWIAFGSINKVPITAGTATKANAILLTPGMAYTRYFPYVPSDEFEATCATTGDSLYVDNQ